jgi:hypothetical protein
LINNGIWPIRRPKLSFSPVTVTGAFPISMNISA